jgi:hypothetical protein
VNVYFVSGLGIDRRIFQKLELPSRFSIHYIDWITPLPHETISHYAQRLSSGIDTSRPFILTGMSFGGIMAVEMNRFIRPEKTIIVSSAATKNGLPPYFKIAGRLQLHKIIPASFLKKPNKLFHWLFGISTPEEINLFKTLTADADPQILKWSIDAAVNWQNTKRPQNLIHIHGSADKLLPVRWVKPDIVVEGGKHFMVFSKADEVSGIIAGIIIASETV